MPTTNLSEYAKKVSENIKSKGRVDLYHWSEISTLIDELVKYVDIIGEGKYLGCHLKHDESICKNCGQ